MEIHVSLEGPDNLSGAIYGQLREAILDGRLRPGDPLPPTRELARRLSVSRTTVMVAYDRLAAGGFVRSRVGAGTFVRETGTAGARAPEVGAAGVLRPRPVWDRIRLSNAFAREARFDFRSGLPDATLFPHDVWRRLMGQQLRARAVGAAFYGSPAGDEGLREAIARHIGLSRGVRVTGEDVTVTNGTQQALDVLARVLLAPGETVAVEDPGYAPPRLLFESLGLSVAGVPMDDEGLIVDALPARARVVYTTPSHQYPLGLQLSLRRRTALLRWAERNDAAIIEDDYDSEFRFGGRPVEALWTLDGGARVIYVGTFSKTMLPTLRLGFVVTPPSLRDAVRRARFVSDWHSPLPTQRALARFMDEGHFARHLRRMSRVYEARHERVMRVLAQRFAGVLEPIPSAAGLHISAYAPGASAQDVAAVVRRAADADVAVQELARLGVAEPARPGLLIGFGAIATANIDEGLQRLRECFEVHQVGRTPPPARARATPRG